MDEIEHGTNETGNEALEVEKVYQRRMHAFHKLQEKQRQADNHLSTYRLVTFILGFALAFSLYRIFNSWAGWATGFFTLILFGYLAVQHHHVQIQFQYTKILSELNQKGKDRFTGKWSKFPDWGEEFKDEDHPYASDLDLFGQASLFQWINSAHTPWGRLTLAEVLKKPLNVRVDWREEWSKRQEAISELARKLSWRQRFEAEGILASDKFQPAEPLLEWAQQSNAAYLHPLFKLAMRILPGVTLLMIGLFSFHGLVPWQIPAILAGIQFLLLRVYSTERSRILATVFRYEASLKTYSRMLKHFEKMNIKADWLKNRQESLRDQEGKPAFKQIARLSKITERISNRQNAMFLVINLLLLWDYQCMIALEEWKRESGPLLKIWLKVLAEVEALSSLANICFDHPDWAKPTLEMNENTTGLSAEEIGHPLLMQKRVTNDFKISSTSGIALITGSNMSGKSTFLRTIGINLVLAYTGAPVCAKNFSCIPMNLWTCMRISDNLEQSISSFYAEILRIKRIVEAAKTNKPVFFLLDEIFKGTNSHDRHHGAKALITQLQKDGALGLISTHDLELGELEKESQGRVKNYHFREFYHNQEIGFDYQLRPGISTTRNALYLIKMAGIELEDDISK